MSTKAPFIYRQPVSGDEFLNRERELGELFNALYRSESTVISGFLRLGKSSLLRRMNDEAIQAQYLGKEAKRFIFVFRDLRAVRLHYTPTTFWEEALAPLRNPQVWKTYAALADLVITDERNRHRWLRQLFKSMGEQGEQLVLLLDEPSSLLWHPNFQHPRFFLLLHTMATHTDGLAIVYASQLTLYELNKESRTLLPAGSPLFNNMLELPLSPFSEEAVNLLLSRGDFSSSERLYIRRMGGHHPFLLQACAASLSEAKGCGKKMEAATRFYEQVALHFDEFWDTLDLRTRLGVVILSLLQLGKCFSPQFHVDIIEQLRGFGRDLRHLAEVGFAEQPSIEMGLDKDAYTWRGERWRVSAQAFAWWVWETMVVQTRSVYGVEEWLDGQDYRFLLTKAQWDELIRSVRSASQSGKEHLGSLERALFDALLKEG